jgi:hypothetical protein
VIGRRSGRRARLGFGLSVIVAIAVGCTSGPLHVDNATDIAVSVYVDDSWVATYAAGTSGAASISGQGRPRNLEVRSPSGAVLMSLWVNDDQLADAAAGRYGNGTAMGLPCGVVTVLIGQLAADEALAPAESMPPGPCP